MYRPRLRWAAVPAIVALIALLAAFASLPVAALQIRRGDVVTIGRDEVVGDTAILAQSAIIEGTVDGDLVIASTEAQITGTVNGRLFWAGEQLTISGRVADSVYAAGVGLSTGPNASIGRDLAMLGLYLTVAPGSSVGQDVLMAGNQAVVEGAVQRDVRFTGLALQIRGPVGAAAISRQAPLPGTEASAQPIAGQSAPERDANQALLPRPGPGRLLSAAWAGAWQAPTVGSQVRAGIANWFRALIAFLVIGGLALWLVPRPFRAAAEAARDRPLASLGFGLLVWLGGYVLLVLGAIVVLTVATILLIVTLGNLASVVVGIGAAVLGLALASFLLLVAYGSKLIVAYLIGLLILDQLARAPRERSGWALLIGVPILLLLSVIPFVGAIVGAAATAIGLGALWLSYRQRWRRPVREAEPEWAYAQTPEERELPPEPWMRGPGMPGNP